uniref:Uncharacterized protein n=1 Tax=Anguilla anguilla TaxID=7936 RepID=A0A0E9Q2I0_ANGAN
MRANFDHKGIIIHI